MADTPKSDSALADLDSDRDSFRRSLASKGFTDDGRVLRGPVEWSHNGQQNVAVVDVTLLDTFPFAPPQVDIVDMGSDITPTFHIERAGNLCLWNNQIPVHDAPWRDVDCFIKKVSGWFEKSATGWPGDEDADLERYLPTDDDIVLYDTEKVESNKFYRLEKEGRGILRLKDELPWSPKPNRMKNKGVRRRERGLLWSADVGAISHPIRNWEDLVDLVGHDLERLKSLIEIGSVEYVLVRYKRGERDAVLAVKVVGTIDGLPAFHALENADTSSQTRTLRAGDNATRYQKKKVAVVGCGAIGSHVADLLFRSGVSHITLFDPERLRPGNLIRHLADNSLVGMPKSVAVRAELGAIGLDADNVKPFMARVRTPKDALDIVEAHDLVVDASADARATALLRWATEELGKHMISVCIQRDGGIARVDRFPLWGGEEHLAPVPILPGDSGTTYEMGCGSPVSKTPPMAVLKAATLGCQVALDELNPWRTPRATIIEVIEPQPDDPYTETGILKAEEMPDD
jgi:molybdopterin/thiamine biosynthesis adenylyltransferase